MKARDLMTENPEFVTPDDPITRAAQIMRDINVGIVPVVDNPDSRKLQGVITDRDIAVRHVAEGHAQECRVRDEMTSGRLDTVRPDTEDREIFELMKRDQIRRIPVVDENNRLLGIVAQADLATRLGRKEPEQVEELVEKVSEPGRPQR
ncbi:MAG TPA: CBS domain-containing protein [Longimicrobiales bacterium]